MQLPAPELAKEIGAIAWSLMFVIVSGAGAVAFFLRRTTQAMDRMAEVLEGTPAMVAELKTLIAERLGVLDQKMDEAIHLGQEHVRIARLWEQTEAPGRMVKSSE